MADLVSAVPVITNNDGEVVIGVAASQVIGLDTAANTIKIDSANNTVAISQTGTDNVVDLAAGAEVDLATGAEVSLATTGNTIKIDNTAGNNEIDIASVNGTAITGSAVPVTLSGGGTPAETSDSANVTKNLGTASLTGFTVIASGTVQPVKAVISTNVAMRVDVSWYNGTSASSLFNVHIPQGGGTVCVPIESGHFEQTAAAGSRFQADAVNLDKNTDADVYVTFLYATS